MEKGSARTLCFSSQPAKSFASNSSFGKTLEDAGGQWRSLASVSALGAEGRGFESHLPDHFFQPARSASQQACPQA